MSDCTLPNIYQVTDIKSETQDIFTLALTPKSGKLPIILPGQFNMLNAFGIGESAISLSKIDYAQNILYHTIHAVGPVTHNLQQLTKGDHLPLRGPFGTPWPLAKLTNKSILLIAGGIGLCPLRPIIEQLIEHQQQYTDIHLIYGTRSPHHLIYQEDLNTWQNKINVLITVDHADDSWKHHVGVITPLIPLAIENPENTVVLICGPEVMMHFSIYSLLALGVLKDNIYLSMERNMQCGTGHCGHCQWGRYFICKDGPVMNYKQINDQFIKSEL